MATSPDLIDFLLDQLSDLPGVRARKMFGEYALYYEEKVVALVCDDQVFLKITEAGKALTEETCTEAEAYPGAKPSILLTGDFIEDRDALSNLIQVTAAELPIPKPRKPRKKKQ